MGRCVEIELATIHRENTDFLLDMNIQTDIVVANQADSFAYEESKDEKGNRVRFITTAFRGVGRNRNTALCYSEDEIILFADDDMQYYDGYADMVERAFDDNPKADIIIFNVDETGRDGIGKNNSVKRVGLLNFTRYGTYRIAIRRKSLVQANLSFSLMFGGGSDFGSGEDTLFLREALRKGLKIYTSPYTIAKVDQSKSTWFKGYDSEVTYYDKGCLIAKAFPVMGCVFKYYFAYKFSKKSSFSFAKCIRLMRNGMKYGKKGIPYKEYSEGKR